MVINNGVLGWGIIAIIGLIDIFLQFVMPDLVPDFIEKATANSSYFGVSFLGEMTIILYVIVGYIFFIGGFFMAIRSYRQSQ